MRRSDRWMHAAVAAAVFASFYVFAAVRSPVPGVNEPHYLAKARHYWDPAWCRGDFFLESAEAHIVFYASVGWVTDWLPLGTAAWLGRAIALGVLAGGWTALVRRSLPGRWSPWWAACVFLLLAAAVDFSGEWIVGGVEGKVLAYGLLFWAFALLGRRLRWAAACAGVAVSFHPVVGAWGLVAYVLGRAFHFLNGRHAPAQVDPAERGGTRAASRLEALEALALLVLCSLPGLVPAMQMLGGPSPEIAAAANRVQVFDRLKHHLDPREFPAEAYIGYGLMIVFWIVARRFALSRPAERRFAGVIAGSIVIALAGLAIGLRPGGPAEGPLMNVRAALLKFYPFRLADALVPAAVAVSLVGLARSWVRSENWPRFYIRPMRRRGLVWLACAAAFAISLLLPAIDRNPSRLPAEELADWEDVCRWIRRSLPQADVSVLTPPESWAFKWYAERPEYVTRKDCPQDAAGIVEWRRRMDERWQWLQALRDSLHRGTFHATLERMGTDIGVTHAILYSGWRAPVPALYRNRTFAVYATRFPEIHD
jgi:hypothetical protein